jgi:peptide deformylase
MKSKIVSIGHPLLRQKTKPLSSGELHKTSLKAFLWKMVRTMRRAHGVGLAANQIASAKRAFVMECRGNKRYPRVASVPLQAYLNARIVKYSKATEMGWEGCLSIPGFRGMVPRAKSVTFTAVTADGRKVRRTVKGFEARIVQHEVDHLNGFFYVDRMKDLKTWTSVEAFNKRFRSKIKD